MPSTRDYLSILSFQVNFLTCKFDEIGQFSSEIVQFLCEWSQNSSPFISPLKYQSCLLNFNNMWPESLLLLTCEVTENDSWLDLPVLKIDLSWHEKVRRVEMFWQLVLVWIISECNISVLLAKMGNSPIFNLVTHVCTSYCMCATLWLHCLVAVVRNKALVRPGNSYLNISLPTWHSNL